MTPLLNQIKEALEERYAVERVLGRGGMATVFLAVERHPQRQVAIKVMNPELANAIGRERFLREVALCATLSHPHIVPIFTAGEVGDLLYYVMPFIDGESLRHRLVRKGALWSTDAVRIARDIARALAYAHRHGVLHRDIKPENILLADEHAVVADFGIARAINVASAGLTRAGALIGTPRYMSPEQAMGRTDLDGRADVYSLGCVLYEMLTGAPPEFPSADKDLAAGRVGDTPTEHRRRLDSLPAGAERILAGALAWNQDDRPTAADLEASLSGTNGKGVTAAGVRNGRRRLIVSAALTVLIAAFVLGLLFRRGDESLANQRVAVAAFENLTGDARLDPVGRMAADWITQGLVQTGMVDVVSSRLAFAAQHTAGAGDSDGTPRTVAAATGATIVIVGSYYLAGDSIRFQCEVAERGGKAVVAVVDDVRASLVQPLAGVEQLRRRVIGALAAVLDPRLGSVAQVASQPPSFEAYQAYVTGLEQFMKLRYSDAVPFLLQAAAADSAFAMPRLLIATIDVELQKWNEAQGIIDALRDTRLSTFDRALLTFTEARVHGDLEGAMSAALHAADVAKGPDAQFLVAVGALTSNRPHAIVHALNSVDPNSAFMQGQWAYWPILGVGYHRLGEHELELAAAKRGRMRYPDLVPVALTEARALASLGRYDDVQRVMIELPALTPHAILGNPAEGIYDIGLEFQAHGYLEESRRLFEQTVRWVDSLPALQRTGQVERATKGMARYALGRWEEADTIFAALSSEFPDSITFRGYRGAIAARRGDTLTARLAIDELGKIDRPYLFGSHRYWQGRIAAVLGDSEVAVRYLRQAVDDGFGFGRLGFGYVFHSDPDLEPLRSSPSFRSLLDPRD